MVCFPFAYHASPPLPQKNPNIRIPRIPQSILFTICLILWYAFQSHTTHSTHPSPQKTPTSPYHTYTTINFIYNFLIFWYTSHLQNTHTTHTKINFIYNLPYFVVYAYFFQVCNFIFESLITNVYQISSLMYIFVITSKVLWDKVLIKIFPKLLLIYIFRKYKISLSSPPPHKKKTLIKVFHSLPL